MRTLLARRITSLDKAARCACRVECLTLDGTLIAGEFNVGQSCLKSNRLHVVVHSNRACYLTTSSKVTDRSILGKGTTKRHLWLGTLV